MTQFRMFPSQASESLAASTTGPSGMFFGFQATSVRIVNDRATAVYVNFNSTVGSTGGFKTCSGEELAIDGIRTVGMGLASTTTSTGTFVRVLAVGG